GQNRCADARLRALRRRLVRVLHAPSRRASGEPRLLSAVLPADPVTRTAGPGPPPPFPHPPPPPPPQPPGRPPQPPAPDPHPPFTPQPRGPATRTADSMGPAADPTRRNPKWTL